MYAVLANIFVSHIILGLILTSIFVKKKNLMDSESSLNIELLRLINLIKPKINRRPINQFQYMNKKTWNW